MKAKKAKSILPEKNQAHASDEAKSNFRNVYLLTKGNTLQQVPREQFNSDSFAERKFRSANELEELVLRNSKVLFGQHTFIVQIPPKKKPLFKGDAVSKNFMLDVGDIAKPRFYILDTLLADNSFNDVFPRVIRSFSYFHNLETRKKIDELFGKNKELKKVLQAHMKEADMPAYLTNAIGNKPFVLIVIDNEIKDLPEVLDTYFKSWEMVKRLVLKKYTGKRNTIFTVNPAFAEIHQNKKQRVIGVPVKEEDHLEKSSDEIKGVYKKLKAELLKINNQLQFNPQRYYISLRKDRNLAFFHFSRKRISLVVKNPEKETRKLIKHHEVKTLTEKVQKFWNGPSCTVVIENTKNLNEIIALLKMLVKR
jgi:predicted transport protein